MRIFRTRWFVKWAKKEKIHEQALIQAVEEMERGLIDADLGGHVYKKRVAIQGRGKSGGVRTLIAYQFQDRAFFIYGFAKNKRTNISNKELQALQIIANNLLNHNDKMLDHLLNQKELVEVPYHE